MVLRALSPADRPTSLAGPMQLPQPTTAEIPELGGLVPSRVAAAVVLLAATAGVVVFSLRSPLQRAAARDDAALARLLAGSSELLSSVELSRAPEQPGIL